MNDKLWFELSSSLEQHHAIFYKLWQMGRPEFSEEVDTAAVKFDKEGNYFRFIFNLEFWNSLDFYNKLFVICHECLHVILNHGVRIKDSKNLTAANQSLDIVVNHLLINKFNFERGKILNWENFCWTDTVFPGDVGVLKEEPYEYYYNLFNKKYGDGNPLDPKNTVDDHNFEPEEFAGKIDDLSLEETQSILESLDRHIPEKANEWLFSFKKPIIKKRKWETIIRNWALFNHQLITRESEQWARLNRRLSILSNEMFLPSEMEIENFQKNKNKLDIYFFLDTSGSCWSYKDRFFSAASSLPESKFNVRLYCFDTEIFETNLRSRKIYGGRGTSFKILEKYVQDQEKYPEGIFVITDGHGDFIKPRLPKNWHWFLVENNTKSFISKDCNFYELSEFE